MTTVAAGARVRVRDKDGKRRALLSAATELFAEEGYDAAATKEIARRAGCSESLIFRYFGDKQGIFEEVVSGQIALAVAHAEEQLAHALPATLKEFIEQLFLIRPMPNPDQTVAGWEISGRALADPGFSQRVFLPNHQARSALISTALEHYQEIGQVDPSIDAPTLTEVIANLTIYTTTMAPRLFGTTAAETRAQIDVAVLVLTRGCQPPALKPPPPKRRSAR
jgi:AcrR family transcriptional regulator